MFYVVWEMEGCKKLKGRNILSKKLTVTYIPFRASGLKFLHILSFTYPSLIDSMS